MSLMSKQFFAYNRWLYESSFDVINVSINTVSTIVGSACLITRRDARRNSLLIELSAAFLGKNGRDNNTTMSWKWVSTERQRLMALHVAKFNGCTVMLTHTCTTSRLSRQWFWWQQSCYVLNMSVNGASMIVGHASKKIEGSCHHIYP